MFNFIQTPIANGCTLFAIEPLSQGDRAFNSTYLPEPIRVSVRSLRNMSDERKHHANAFNARRRIAEASAARRSRWCRRNDLCWLLLGLSRVNRTRVPLLWTRATRCCLRRNQPRSNEITATERKFLHRSSVGCWHAQQAATPPVVPETRTSRRAIWDHRHHTNFVQLES